MKRMKLTQSLGTWIAMAAMLAACAICLPAHGSPYNYITKPDAPLPEQATLRIGTIGYHDGALSRTNAAVSPDFKFVLIEQPDGKGRKQWELWNLETQEKKIISNQLSDYGEEEELKETLLPMTKNPDKIDRSFRLAKMSLMGFSSDGRHFYAKCDYGFELCSFVKLDLAKKELVEAYGDGAGTTRTVSFSADRKRAAINSHGRETKVHVWDLEKGVKLWTAPQMRNGTAFSPDGRFAICGGEPMDALSLRDMETGEKLWETPQNDKVYRAEGMAFHPDSQHVLVPGEVLSMREVKTGKKIMSFPTEAGRCISVAYSPDGTEFLSGHENGIICHWNTGTGKILRTFKGHERYVHDLVYDKDGSQFISMAGDGTAMVWKLPK